MSIWTAIAGNSGLFSGGLGLLGGLFGSKQEDRRRHEEYARQDTQLQRLVKDAEAAGLSPLAALGSSAAGSFATPVGSSNTGNWLSDSMSQIGGGISEAMAKRSPEAKLTLKNKALQNDLLQAQIDAINSDTVREARGARASEARINENVAKQEVPHAYIRVFDNRTGKYTWLPNPDLAMEPGEMATMLGAAEAYAGGLNEPRIPSDPKNPSFGSEGWERGPVRQSKIRNYW